MLDLNPQIVGLGPVDFLTPVVFLVFNNLLYCLFLFQLLQLVRKDMDVNGHERLLIIAIRHIVE